MDPKERFDEIRRKFGALLGRSIDKAVEDLAKEYEATGLAPAAAEERAQSVAADSLEELKRKLLTRRKGDGSEET